MSGRQTAQDPPGTQGPAEGYPDRVAPLNPRAQQIWEQRAKEKAEFRALLAWLRRGIVRLGAAVEKAYYLFQDEEEKAPFPPAGAASTAAPNPRAAGAVVTEEDGTVVALVNTMIEAAYKQDASDIHLEPSPGRGVLVRFRVDGLMKKAMEFPWEFHRAVISRLKIMANLDIAERRRSQSGKIRFSQWNPLDVELRLEVYPTIDDVEDASLRLLGAARRRRLDDLDLTERNLAAMRKLLANPSGLFLCVGPSGSGKTTTLHGALSFINDDTIKILTAEDPVEITQPGVRQLQINHKAHVTFADALRSFLRADPDVIMIGEMRDFETASIAVEASLTGHLVFSTLHTNSAPETITRMLDMGLDAYAFSDALLAVLAQRLARTLCPICHVKVADPAQALEGLRKEYNGEALFAELLQHTALNICQPRKVACQRCDGAGYAGRMAIHELLILNDEIRPLIIGKSSAIPIREAAVRSGMRDLKQDGIEKVLAGRTTLSEVNTVCMR